MLSKLNVFKNNNISTKKKDLLYFKRINFDNIKNLASIFTISLSIVSCSGGSTGSVTDKNNVDRKSISSPHVEYTKATAIVKMITTNTPHDAKVNANAELASVPSKVVLTSVSEVNQTAQAATVGANPWENNKLYSFHHTNCYGGAVNSNICTYQSKSNTDKVVITDKKVTIYHENTVKQEYVLSSQPKQIIGFGTQIFILGIDQKLWIYNFNGDLHNELAGDYNDMLAIDFNEVGCNNDQKCKNEGYVFQSLLLLTKPEMYTSTTGSNQMKSQMVQIFPNGTAADTGEKLWQNDADMKTGHRIINWEIKNDVPLASTKVINYSFGAVNDTTFNIQLIYERHGNKGNAYQTYYAGFIYGENLIKQDVSKNTLPRSKDHLTIFAPVAKPPKFEGLELHKNTITEIRKYAGGDNDKDDNYTLCMGMNVYCEIGTRAGIQPSYTSDIINNAIFLGVGIASSAAFDAGAAKIATKLEKGGRAIFGKVANFVIPLAGDSGISVLMQLYSKQLSQIFYDITTENMDNALPILSTSIQPLLNFPAPVVKPCGRGCTYRKKSSCEINMMDQLNAREIELRKNPDKSIYGYPNTVYDLYTSIAECNVEIGKKITPEQEEIMKGITIDGLDNFKSSTVAIIYQKMFIDSNNANKITIDDISGNYKSDLEYFQDDVTQKDDEQPMADISLRISNCKGACDGTYFADAQGNYLKNKINGSEVSAINGNFLYVYYMRTDSDFRVPVFSTMAEIKGAFPANLTYGKSAYQLSDLTCNQFNAQIKKITGNDTAAALAAAHGRDHWSIIIDKDGAACNEYDRNKLGNLVYPYNEALFNDIVMSIPMSINPTSLVFMYAINIGFGVWGEIVRLNSLDPYTYSIRNGHVNTGIIQEKNGYECAEIKLSLEDGESLKQVSPSHLPDGGLWVVGDQGLHYLDKNDQHLYNFDFNQFGTGVASSYKGKLIVSAQGDVSAAVLSFATRYDERNLLNLGAEHYKDIKFDQLWYELCFISDLTSGELTNNIPTQNGIYKTKDDKYFQVYNGKLTELTLKNKLHIMSEFKNNQKLQYDMIIKLFDGYTDHLHAIPRINIDNYKEGNFPSVKGGSFSGKLYIDQKNILYISYTHTIEKAVLYAWDVNTMNIIGGIYRENVDGTNAVSGGINNFAIAGDDTIFWLPWNSDMLNSINFDGNSKVTSGLKLGSELGITRPFMFNIYNNVFVASDDGKVYTLDGGRTKLNEIENMGTGFEAISDVAGRDDGRFYMLYSKKLFGCKMPSKYISKPLKLNFINESDQLSKISMKIPDSKYIKIEPVSGYPKLSYNEYSLDMSNYQTQSIQIYAKQSDFDELDGKLIMLTPKGGQTLADGDFIGIGVKSGSFKVDFRQAANKFIVKVTQVSDNEFDVKINANLTNSSIAKISVDQNGDKYLESQHENFAYTNYTRPKPKAQDPLIISSDGVSDVVYKLRMSKCQSGELILLYEEISGGQNETVTDIKYIRNLDGSTIKVADFCRNESP